RHVTLVYLIPVVVAATRLGTIPAVVAAIAGVGASAFFFYAPIYSFLVDDPQHLIELPLYVFVAIVTGHLAASLRRQADLARRREHEVRDLYTFSRRLAAAHTANDIYGAIREHLTAVIGCRTLLFETTPEAPRGAIPAAEDALPARVRHEAKAVAEGRMSDRKGGVIDDGAGHAWIIRPVSGKTGDFAVLAIDLGVHAGDAAERIRQRVDTVL